MNFQEKLSIIKTAARNGVIPPAAIPTPDDGMLDDILVDIPDLPELTPEDYADLNEKTKAFASMIQPALGWDVANSINLARKAAPLLWNSISLKQEQAMRERADFLRAQMMLLQGPPPINPKLLKKIVKNPPILEV